jgi:hypothetical protein
MSEDICSICWDDMQDPSVQLACKHRFHYGCISEWGKRNHACPLCRQTFAEPAAAAEAPVWIVEEGEIGGEQLLTMVLSGITALRCLAIMCPNFVERLFEPQIKLGRSLSTFWQRYRNVAPTALAALLICSVH